MIRQRSIVLAAALALAACGGGTAATTEASTTTSADGVVTVHVTASDFGFQSDVTTFQAGMTYRFVVDNVGQVAHEMMLVQPIAADSGMDMEMMDSMALVNVEDADLAPGAEATVDYTFTQDDVGKPLEFACHDPGHYEAGMHETLTVTG